LLAGVFDGTGGAVVGALVGGALAAIGGWRRRRRKVRAAEIDTTEAQTKTDRELLETMYGALVTAEPTPLNPHPQPGLLDRVDRLERERPFSGTITPDGRLEGVVSPPTTE
jgi:hypothetical protein